MEERVLFVSNTANFSKFNAPFIEWFNKRGWLVDYASLGEESVPYCKNEYKIPMTRSPFSIANIKAYVMLKRIIKKGNYKIIHCHTPVGGVLARLAAHHSKECVAKVIYTAHGFHFFKGASIFNWIVYYPVEKWLSRYSDAIVTINNEDYELAKKKFAKTKVFKINGVGVDLRRFGPIDFNEKTELRKRYGYAASDFIIIYIAEFIKRKNHKMLIECLPELKKKIPSLRVIFAGSGKIQHKMKKMVEKIDMESCVSFMGYRKDIPELCRISDLHVATSVQEGQGLNNIEAMATGLPIVCSAIRGHSDVVLCGRNGYTFNLSNKNKLIECVVSLYENKAIIEQIRKNNLEDVQKYSTDNAVENMVKIYKLFI